MRIKLTPESDATPRLARSDYSSQYQVFVRHLKTRILQQLEMPQSFDLVLKHNGVTLLDSDILSDPDINLTYHIQYFG